MPARHKGFYQDFKAGRHDEYDEETVSPETPNLEGGTFTGHVDALSLDAASAAASGELRYDGGHLYPYAGFLDFYGDVDGPAAWAAAKRPGDGGAPSAAAGAPPPSGGTPLTLHALPFKEKKKKGSGGKKPAGGGGGGGGGGAKQQDAGKSKLVTPEEMQELMRRQQEQRSTAASPQQGGRDGMGSRVSSTLRLDVVSSGGVPDGCSVSSRSISPHSMTTASARTVSPRAHPRAPIKQPIKQAATRLKGRTDGEAITATAGLRTQKKETVLQDGKHHINVVVVGHVDAGKSTIMGHILYKLDAVPQRLIHKYEKDSKASGKQSFHFAWVLDETEEERERGVTMDVAVTYFATKTKQVTLLDCPGHRDFVANMITGATQADAAVVVVNAVNGEFEAGFSPNGQTKEHIVLLRSVGVSQLIVAVNKMDSVNYCEERYQGIKAELSGFLRQSGFKDDAVTYIPIAGLPGENLTETTVPELKAWWSGGSLLSAIDGLHPPERLVEYPLRVCVSDVMKQSTTLGLSVGGKISTGRLQTGDKVILHPVGETATVKGIERSARGVDEAVAGDNVEIGLSHVDPTNLSVGLVMCGAADPHPVKICQRFEAALVMFSDTMITKSFQCVIHLQSTVVGATVSRLLTRLDGKSDPVTKPKCLKKNQTGTVEITTLKPVCLELADEFRDLGRFMLRAGGETVAAGVVKRIFPLVKAQ